MNTYSVRNIGKLENFFVQLFNNDHRKADERELRNNIQVVKNIIQQ